MNSTQSTKLAPPGAGLPWPELQIARLLFGIRCRLGSRESFVRTFRGEQKLIRSLLDSFPPDLRGERILIPRAVGLEDSSRNYSAWMVLDHLRIVNNSCVEVISQLTRGNVPSGQASTASVKPDPLADASVEPSYEESCLHVLTTLESISSLKTEVCYNHPWFGPLDAHQWGALVAMHMGIHRNQLAIMLKHPRI